MFDQFDLAPPDPILALSVAFKEDTRSEKLDLGVGVYRDSAGATPVMEAVKAAERRLVETQPTKAYVGLAGNPQFNAAMTNLVFGSDAATDRIRAVQAPGGCGALRILFDMIARGTSDATVWVSDPTWPNHIPIISASNLETKTYPYFDPATGTVRVDDMLDTFKTLGPNDIVLLHGCCHNPTGAELSPEAWSAIADVAADRGFLPFVDFAYQGFGNGIEADAAGFRTLASRVEEMVVASSCSKNVGLYRERTGCAFVLAGSEAGADKARSQLFKVARASYSMPPDHGAAIVATILEDEALRASWESELDSMRERMLELRRKTADALRLKTNSDRFDFVAEHRGMFSLMGTTPEQVDRLREDWGVYMVKPAGSTSPACRKTRSSGSPRPSRPSPVDSAGGQTCHHHEEACTGYLISRCRSRKAGSVAARAHSNTTISDVTGATPASTSRW